MMFIGLFVAAKVGYSFMTHNNNSKAGCKKSFNHSYSSRRQILWMESSL